MARSALWCPCGRVGAEQGERNMDRRKFLIAAGSTAVGTSALVGSGAFSAAQIRGREANINVNADDEALVQLIPGQDSAAPGDSTVTDNRVFLDDGELNISFNDHGNGVNRNSTYQVGAIGEDQKSYLEDDPFASASPPLSFDDVIYGDGAGSLTDSRSDYGVRDDPAFVIRNGTAQDLHLQLSYDNTSAPDDSIGALVMAGKDGWANSGGGAQLAGEAFPMNGPVNTDYETTTWEVPPGEWAGVSLIVKVGDANVNDPGWQGSLEVRAEQAVRQN
jgi:hypothetical protein